MPRKNRSTFRLKDLTPEQRAKRERCILKVKAANARRGAQGKKTYNAHAVCNAQIMGKIRKGRGKRRTIEQTFFDFLEGLQG